MNDASNPNHSYVDTYAPPATTGNNPATDDSYAPAMPMATNEPAAPSQEISQALEDQNIFTLLGVDGVEDSEKESFLDELQQVIWEDFLDNDVELLITDSENAELKQIMDKPYNTELDKQEAIVVFLEKLIPDLEEIMLEKALELKQDMAEERLASMREMYASEPAKLETLNQAQNLMQQDKWLDAAQALNALH